MKLFAILTLALLPLGIVALLASLQTSRDSNARHRADLNVATSEASRKLTNELIADGIVLMQDARSAAQNRSTGSNCERSTAIFAARPSRPARFAIYGALDTPICSGGGTAPRRPVLDRPAERPTLRIIGEEAELTLPVRNTNVIAVVRYSPTALAAFARPAGYNAAYGMSLRAGGATLDLVDRLPNALRRNDTAVEALGIADAELTVTVARAPFGPAEFLITFLPLLMWASAALVGFVVVDRVLIEPLQRLRADVAVLVPGAPMPPRIGATPAIEIDELRSAFADFADRLGERERELQAALAEQVGLTREVHHRVKNNLQVIASLISLHARGNREPMVGAAYATIQRRVDALAIVHRNLFAELESDRGIDVRTLLAELASNFRANAVGDATVPAITLNAVSVHVAQDTAMPVAFLFTELTELSVLARPDAPVRVIVTALTAGTASFAIESDGLRALPEGTSYAMRIVEGLSRQLRAPLDHDAIAGRYTIAFPVSE